MKKHLIAILLAAVIIFSLIRAFAAEKAISITDELEIVPPAGFYAYWLEMPEDDSALAAADVTKTEAVFWLVENESDVSLLHKNYDIEVHIDAEPSALDSLEEMSEAERDLFAEYVNQRLIEELGAMMAETVYMEMNDLFFIKSTAYQIDDSTYATIYIYRTIYDGQAVDVYIGSNTDSSSANMEAIYDSVIEGIRIKGYEGSESISKEQKFIEYTGEVSGTTFSIPEDWIAYEEDNGNVHFTPIYDESITVMYAFYDNWENMSAQERIEFSRSEYNTELIYRDFTENPDIVEEFFQEQDLKLSMESLTLFDYEGREYIKMETEPDDFGERISFMSYVENGISHMYFYTMEEDNPYYNDLLTIAAKAEYSYDSLITEEKPAAVTETKTETEKDEAEPASESERQFTEEEMEEIRGARKGALYLVAIIIAICIRKSRKNKSEEQEAASENNIYQGKDNF